MVGIKRGIRNDNFIKALQKLSEVDGWWRDVLSDKSLIITVREECLTVYWLGLSIFHVEMKGDAIVTTIHPRYLFDRHMEKDVSFDGKKFALDPAHTLIQSYKPGKTLEKLKYAAELFATEEKTGVHNIVTSTVNDNVVDIEIEMAEGRADIATFQETRRDVRLVFWEAKTFYNPELPPDRKKNVVNQIKKYKDAVAALRPSMIESYTCVAKNLIAFANMSEGHRKYNNAIHKVALGDAELSVDPADIGLIVFGFDKAQRIYFWTPLRKRLITEIEPRQIRASGDTKKLKLYLRH